ncbi:MAG: DinB family protein [Chloroflexi bacterium]|nr:MAG: DinB family protein [Chloroflexota bacterium]
MNTLDYLRAERRRLHEALRFTVSDLTTEEWHFTIPSMGNHIAFLMWHLVRTEDNVLNPVLQGQRPVWKQENWHERLALPPRLQGTGMSTEEAIALHINDPALFMEYTEHVWQASEHYLSSISDGGALLSQRMITLEPLGERSALELIGHTCLLHPFLHLGEITLLRGALGKQGFPI